MRTWLKWGIVFGLVDLVFLISILSGHSDGSIFISITHVILFWFANLHDSNFLLQKILIAIQGVIFYFIVGSVIGWMVERARTKKENIEKLS